MLSLVAVPVLILGLLGCQDSAGPNFGGGGLAAGTGDAGGGDGGGNNATPSAPVITDLTAEFYTPPNYTMVMQIYAWWTDDEGDILGGKVDYQIDGDNGDSLGGTLEISGKEARLDDDLDGTPVFFWVKGVTSNANYDVEVTLIDAAGHRSVAATTSTQ
ncbi:MAG: hypothetical protein GXP62_11255 [Oligoflexia bacterium]|nr:hypothetical protein [Oligoflexia bacterium]